METQDHQDPKVSQEIEVHLDQMGFQVIQDHLELQVSRDPKEIKDHREVLVLMVRLVLQVLLVLLASLAHRGHKDHKEIKDQLET